MKIPFIHKSLFAFLLFVGVCSATNAQGKKDIAWSLNGLTSNNYRLVKDHHKKDDFRIGAVTSSSPKMDASVENIGGKRVLKITMSNFFNYKKSWMLKSQANNAALLKHEQGHFDLNEIYTRKTFQQLKNFTFTQNYQAESQNIAQQMNDELKQIQNQYEQQTIYGLNTKNQEMWSERIASELASLPSYQNATIEKAIEN